MRISYVYIESRIYSKSLRDTSIERFQHFPTEGNYVIRIHYVKRPDFRGGGGRGKREWKYPSSLGQKTGQETDPEQVLLFFMSPSRVFFFLFFFFLSFPFPMSKSD